MDVETLVTTARSGPAELKSFLQDDVAATLRSDVSPHLLSPGAIRKITNFFFPPEGAGGVVAGGGGGDGGGHGSGGGFGDGGRGDNGAAGGGGGHLPPQIASARHVVAALAPFAAAQGTHGRDGAIQSAAVLRGPSASTAGSPATGLGRGGNQRDSCPSLPASVGSATRPASGHKRGKKDVKK